MALELGAGGAAWAGIDTLSLFVWIRHAKIPSVHRSRAPWHATNATNAEVMLLHLKWTGWSPS